LKARLIFVRQTYTPFGGAERFLALAMEQLGREGVEMEILCRRWKGDDGVRHTRIAPPYVGRLWRDAGFHRAACNWLRRHEGALVQSHERIPCCDIYRAGDGLHREWLIQRGRSRSRLGRLIERTSPYHRYTLTAERRLFSSPRLRAVICNSTMVRDEIVHHYAVRPEILHVIPNGVDSERFHPGLRATFRDPVRRKFGIPHNAVMLTIIGSGFQRKGVGPLIQALAQAPSGAHLLVVGKSRHAARYRRLPQRLGLAGRVHFAGPQEDPRPFYAAADIYAHPALYDPAPNAVLEAMACGLPVIVSAKTGNSDIIRSQRAGMVCDALDIGAIAEAIGRLRDPSQRSETGENALRTAETFSLTRMTDAYLALYRELLDTNPYA